ncbi:MAG: hypothetical protein K2Q22_02690, partial [Cytophagales bacterium]|nr:hypothetical protein [Cytophagales bacterium]
MKKAFLFLSFIVLCSISIIARASENLPNEFSVSPNAVSLSSASSTYNYIYVDAPGNWSITSAPSWFTTYNSSGSGSQYIYYSVPTNFGQDRSGIVTFYDSFNAKSYDLAVNQQGYNSSIYYFTPSLNFGATNPTSNSVNMYTTYDQWALSSAPSWISLTSNIITGNGSGYLSFNAIAEVNRGPNRSGVLVVKNLSNQVTKSIFVTQSSTVNGFAVSPSAIIFQSASYTTSNLIEVTAADNWSASYPSWLSLSPPAGTGNQKVSLSPDYNNGLN